MGLKDLLGKLDSTLTTPKGRAAKQVVAIESLVHKLELKAVKYQKKLEAAATDYEKEKLNRKIKVCNAQIKKGKAAANELRLETI